MTISISMKSLNVLALTAFLVFSVFCPLEASAANSLPADSVEASALVKKMNSKTKGLKSYSFKYKMQVFKGKKTIVENGAFYYKQPNLIRLEEEGPYKKGAVAVLTSKGHVKAHLGGNYKIFVVKLAPDSKFLKSANGHPMIESDFKSLTGYLKKYQKLNMQLTTTKVPVKIAGIKEKVFILEIRKAKKASKLWKKVAVSAKTYLPVKWWDFKDNGKLHSIARWHHVKQNRYLPDALFTIKHAKSAKKQIAIQAKKKSSPKNTLSKTTPNKTTSS